MTFALPCSDPTFPEPQIMASMTLRTRKVEPVGHLYQSYYQNHQANMTGAYKKDDSLEGSPMKEAQMKEESEDDEATKLDAAAEAKLKEAMNKKRKQKQQSSLGDLSKKNHYELLLLEDATASEDQIKKSFRKLSLIYHPDKYEEGKYNESAKAKWLQLGSAYETLMDKDKRRIYDSTMEFDDSIPDATLGPNDDFYDLWGPVFKRNQYWSTDQKKVVPFGDDSTPIKKVISFYNFWEGFVSWRDFKMDDEYDVMQAENRYEKRWMEKENKKMKSDLHKEEKQRVVKMVKRAKKVDPRMIRKEKEDAEAREKVLLVKENKKKARQEEFERKAREVKEVAEKLVSDAAEKLRLEIEGRKNKKNYGKIRNDEFKQACSTKLSPVTAKKYDRFWADEFVKKLKPDEIEKASEKLNTFDKFDEASEWFEDFVNGVNKVKNTTFVDAKQKAKNDAEQQKLQEVWSPEELQLLSKATLKFPVGMGGRWEMIQKFIGGKKNVYQVKKFKTKTSIGDKHGY